MRTDRGPQRDILFYLFSVFFFFSFFSFSFRSCSLVCFSLFFFPLSRDDDGDAAAAAAADQHRRRCREAVAQRAPKQRQKKHAIRKKKRPSDALWTVGVVLWRKRERKSDVLELCRHEVPFGTSLPPPRGQRPLDEPKDLFVSIQETCFFPRASLSREHRKGAGTIDATQEKERAKEGNETAHRTADF